jgi:hypothetical protein
MLGSTEADDRRTRAAGPRADARAGVKPIAPQRRAEALHVEPKRGM